MSWNGVVAPSQWGCAHSQRGASKGSKQICRSAKVKGVSGANWKRQLADATGVKYHPQREKDEEWSSSGAYNAQGKLVVREPSDNSDEDSDDDEWTDAFDDDQAFVEDKEIYNIQSGWSVQDWVGDGKQSKGNAQEVHIEEDEEQTQQRGMAANAILKSIPAHVLKALEQQQTEADELNQQTKAKRKKKKKPVRKTAVGSMRIITGSAAGKRLASPPGEGTRPMMEKVRGAVFSMIASMAGSQPLLPPGSRWLDLFAGTGAVGLEALSRGCQECHFVEMDPAVARDSLARNIAACGVTSQATVLTLKAEDYLKNAQSRSSYATGLAFDYISVCPPYEAVSYEELYDLLDASPLLHDDSVVVVEYAKRLSNQIRDTMGPLHKVRDKSYGRTLVAVYGPAE